MSGLHYIEQDLGASGDEWLDEDVLEAEIQARLQAEVVMDTFDREDS